MLPAAAGADRMLGRGSLGPAQVLTPMSINKLIMIDPMLSDTHWQQGFKLNHIDWGTYQKGGMNVRA